jgi:hypothetical protein
MNKPTKVIATAQSGHRCESCGRDTEPVALEGVPDGMGRVRSSVWRCIDRKGCRLAKLGIAAE